MWSKYSVEREHCAATAQYQVEACELAYFMAVLDCFVFLPLTAIPLSLNSSRFGCSHLIACRVHRLNLQLLHMPIGYHKNNRSHARPDPQTELQTRMRIQNQYNMSLTAEDLK